MNEGIKRGRCRYCDLIFEGSNFANLGRELLKHRKEAHPEIESLINKAGLSRASIIFKERVK